MGCMDQQNNQEYLGYCVKGWATYYDKIYAVKDQLEIIKPIKEYIVVKQGMDGTDGGYWFMLIGLKANEGIVVYMSDTIKNR